MDKETNTQIPNLVDSKQTTDTYKSNCGCSKNNLCKKTRPLFID
jgi:hypothetical protein